MAETSAKTRLDRLLQDCQKAFEKHVITKTSDRRWLIQRLHEDGVPDWTFAAEIICTEGGGIYVGGDIFPMIFAYGPKDPLERLYWIGTCRDIDYYVAQKARIGLGAELCEEWDSDIAHAELKERMRDDSREYEVKNQDAYECALETSEHESFMNYVVDAFGVGAYEWVGSLGNVVSGRVVCAHAAVSRLCQLLDAEKVKVA